MIMPLARALLSVEHPTALVGTSGGLLRSGIWSIGMAWHGMVWHGRWFAVRRAASFVALARHEVHGFVILAAEFVHDRGGDVVHADVRDDALFDVECSRGQHPAGDFRAFRANPASRPQCPERASHHDLRHLGLGREFAAASGLRLGHSFGHAKGRKCGPHALAHAGITSSADRRACPPSRQAPPISQLARRDENGPGQHRSDREHAH
ncbi:hypothetical protein [Saccharopolyspora spinosa]|uniref:hypothetical protein n=1 Tax=Saccharopolyspora spinosa TaxID=60894 RepID=UPI00117B36F4|nr:hypothetical protein [Saccharopolyspora spinosa]